MLFMFYEMQCEGNYRVDLKTISCAVANIPTESFSASEGPEDASRGIPYLLYQFVQ